MRIGTDKDLKPRQNFVKNVVFIVIYIIVLTALSIAAFEMVVKITSK